MSKKKKALAIFIVVVVIAVVITLGIGSSWFTNSDLRTWFGKGKDKGGESTTVKVFAVSDSGDVMQQYGVYEMPAALTIIPNDNSQFTSSNEVTLVTSLNGNVSYTYYFENPVSTWASGKTANDFVAVKPVSDDGKQVKLISKGAFGESIILKAIQDGSDKFATCKLDYLQSITSTGKVSLGGSDATDDANIESAVSFGLGTVRGTVSLTSALLTLDESFTNKFNEYLNFDVTIEAYRYDLKNSTVELLDNYVVVTDGQLRYSMFIKGFDGFTQNQKDGVYFAWYNAYKAYVTNNIYIDIFVNYSYKGNVISAAVEESDIPGGRFTGWVFYDEMLSDEIIHDNATN